jgi:hypothetical protein
MILNHIAAIVFFSGPLFYVGLLMAVDPVGTARISGWFVRVLRNLMHCLRGIPSCGIVESEHADVSRRLRSALRFAGVGLLLLAIVI